MHSVDEGMGLAHGVGGIRFWDPCECDCLYLRVLPFMGRVLSVAVEAGMVGVTGYR